MTYYSQDPDNDPGSESQPLYNEPATAQSTPGAVVRYDSKPYVSYILLGVTIAVFALQFLSEQLLGQDIPALYGMKINPLISAGQFWRLFTPMLLHGSLWHLGFNMYALYILGPGLERFYGHGRFLALYVIAGFCGNVMSFVMTPNPSLGSSTAIFGLLAAQGILIFQNKELFGENANRSLQNIIMVAVINFVIGLSPGIDNWGHLGGFIGGTIFAWLGGPKLQVISYGFQRRLVDVRNSSEVLLASAVDLGLFGALAFFSIG